MTHKCEACEYEAGYRWEGNKRIKVGQDEFKEIDGTFTVHNDYSYRLDRVRLFICPACNNVIAED